MIFITGLQNPLQASFRLLQTGAFIKPSSTGILGRGYPSGPVMSLTRVCVFNACVSSLRRTSQIATAPLFCVPDRCGKRMCQHRAVTTPLLGCLKCGQPAFYRFPVRVPQAAVFYFRMHCLCFGLFLITPSDVPLLRQPAVFTHICFHLPPKSDLDFPPFPLSLKAACVNQVGVLQT